MRVATVTVILTLSVCLSNSNPSAGQTTTTTPPTTPTTTSTDSAAAAKGKQIGEIVSSAVNTAFPIIGKIMDLFPAKKNSVSKPDVSAAVTKAQTDTVTAAKQEVKGVATVSKELGVIQAFATSGVSASQNLATISRALASDKPNYDTIGTEWGIAKNYLADVLTMKPEDVQSVRDVTIQARIITLQKARKDLMARIDKNIEFAQKKSASFSKQDFQAEIASMSGLLDGFDTLAAVELSALQADIDNLAKWANSPAGPIEFNAKPPSSTLLKIIDNAAANAQSVADQQ